MDQADNTNPLVNLNATEKGSGIGHPLISHL